jgi:hypothetical protein
MVTTPEHPTRFDSTLDLAELPWFELTGGRLRLREGLGPIIDIHTHLALNYVPWSKVDLLAEGPPARHFLPLGRPLDLDVYVNKNLTGADVANIKANVVPPHRAPDWPTHTLPNLLMEMEQSAITHSVLLPVDYPVLSRNARRYLKVSKGEGRIVCFGSVHPFQPGMRRHLDRQVKLGARGIKFHPGGQAVPPSHPRAMKLYRLCGERDLPIFWHCGPVGIDTEGMSRRCQVEGYRAAIEENPDTTFVLGHAGALQMDVALELCASYPNTWLDLSCQSVGNIAKMLDDADSTRILHGSDWPFYHQAIGVAKVLMVTQDQPELRARVLWGNAARLLGIA